MAVAAGLCHLIFFTTRSPEGVREMKWLTFRFRPSRKSIFRVHLWRQRRPRDRYVLDVSGVTRPLFHELIALTFDLDYIARCYLVLTAIGLEYDRVHFGSQAASIRYRCFLMRNQEPSTSATSKNIGRARSPKQLLSCPILIEF
jgi:hypothetical protein